MNGGNSQIRGYHVLGNAVVYIGKDLGNFLVSLYGSRKVLIFYAVVEIQKIRFGNESTHSVALRKMFIPPIDHASRHDDEIGILQSLHAVNGRRLIEISRVIGYVLIFKRKVNTVLVAIHIVDNHSKQSPVDEKDVVHRVSRLSHPIVFAERDFIALRHKLVEFAIADGNHRLNRGYKSIGFHILLYWLEMPIIAFNDTEAKSGDHQSGFLVT